MKGNTTTICKFYNFTFDGRFPCIRCKSDKRVLTNEFLHEEGREKYHRDFCCKEYYRCGIYKVLKMGGKYNEKC